MKWYLNRRQALHVERLEDSILSSSFQLCEWTQKFLWNPGEQFIDTGKRALKWQSQAKDLERTMESEEEQSWIHTDSREDLLQG